MKFIDNPEENLDKYKTVFADIPDGKRIMAEREEQDEQFHPSWMYEIGDDPKNLDYSKISAFRGLECSVKEPVTTPALIRIGQEKKSGRWYTYDLVSP